MVEVAVRESWSGYCKESIEEVDVFLWCEDERGLERFFK